MPFIDITALPVVERLPRHSVKALTDGRAIIVDHPVRREFA